nr:hypothetical protein [Tanacetum cinerariifolium]
MLRTLGVKLLGVPVAAFCKDGLSAIATKLDNTVVAMPKLVKERFYTCIVHVDSTSTTPIVEKIDKIKRLIIKGKVTIVDDEGKPLTKVDSSGDHDSEDEVASVDNDMTNFMASKKDIPDKIQDICNNLDMKVRGRKKK